MIATSDLFQFTQLAEASYALFENFVDPMDALRASEMTNFSSRADASAVEGCRPSARYGNRILGNLV